MTEQPIPVYLTPAEWRTCEDLLCAGVASLNVLSANALPGLDVIELIEAKTAEVQGICGAIKRVLGPTLEELNTR